jgi:hypothetical protein
LPGCREASEVEDGVEELVLARVKFRQEQVDGRDALVEGATRRRGLTGCLAEKEGRRWKRGHGGFDNETCSQVMFQKRIVL